MDAQTAKRIGWGYAKWLKAFDEYWEVVFKPHQYDASMMPPGRDSVLVGYTVLTKEQAFTQVCPCTPEISHDQIGKVYHDVARELCALICKEATDE